MPTVYITKYALTQGIIRRTGERSARDPSMIVCPINALTRDCYHGKDWHETLEAAMHRAEEMRIAQLDSLYRKVEKYENMKFLVEDIVQND